MRYTSFKVAVIFGVISALVGGWLIFNIGSKSDQLINLQVEDTCNLNVGSCQAVSRSGERVEFSILPVGIPLLTPLDLTVKLYGLEADSIEVVFTGIDVNMGRLAYTLNSIDGITYKGAASLSICSKQKMKWSALILIKLDSNEIKVPFQFETEYVPDFKLI